MKGGNDNDSELRPTNEGLLIPPPTKDSMETAETLGCTPQTLLKRDRPNSLTKKDVKIVMNKGFNKVLSISKITYGLDNLISPKI